MTTPKTFTRLRPDEAAAWLAARPQALRLDAREARHFGAGHLPGSLRLDGRNHEALLMGQPRTRPVFITCYHGNASQTYAQMFVDFGFADVADLVGGMAAWPAAGLIGADVPAATALATPAATAAAPAASPVTAAALSSALATWLAEQGFADAHHSGRHGNTALMQAAWQGRADLVDELLALGVDRHAANGDGNTALWLACVANQPALVQRLVAAGLAIDHANLTGATALMYAASSSKPAIVQTLLALGADPLLTTQDDFSALDMAASLECLQLLRAATRAPRAPQAARATAAG